MVQSQVLPPNIQQHAKSSFVHKIVNQFFADLFFPVLWEQYKNNNPALSSVYIGQELSTKLGLPVCTLDEEQSKFFKRHYNNDKHNLGPLVTEMDVIRRIEGW